MVLRSLCWVRSWSAVRPWFPVLGPDSGGGTEDQGPGTDGAPRTKDPGRSRNTLALIALLVLLTVDGASAQCAMCRRALQSLEGRQMIAAFRSGILILIAAPFSLFAAVAVLAVRMNRRRHGSL